MSSIVENKQIFKTILHPTDFDEGSYIAFIHALRLSLEFQGKLNLLHVERPGSYTEWRHFPGVRETLKKWGIIADAKDSNALDGLGLRVQKVISRRDDPVKATLSFMKKKPSDLVVLAAYCDDDDERIRWMQKSIAEPIARDSRERTLIIPGGAKPIVSSEDGSINLRNILIPVHESSAPNYTLDIVTSFVRELGLTDVDFHLLYVGEDEERPYLDLPNWENWKWNWVVKSGKVADVIVSTSLETSADMLVMTSAGHHGFLDALRGSITEQVLRKSSCPLLALHRF